MATVPAACPPGQTPATSPEGVSCNLAEALKALEDATNAYGELTIAHDSAITPLGWSDIAIKYRNRLVRGYKKDIGKIERKLRSGSSSYNLSGAIGRLNELTAYMSKSVETLRKDIAQALQALQADHG